jgi:hypothetical protein
MPIPGDLAALYEIHEWRNGIALLEHVHPEEFRDVVEVLREFRLRRSHLVKANAPKGEAEPADEDDCEENDDSGDTSAAAGGGNKSKIAKELDREFSARGWVEALFDTQVSVTASRRLKGRTKRKKDPPSVPFDSMTYAAPTHNVDCYKNHVALEVEWNNKNPFFDRDLNNFRLLFDLRSVEVGVIITRCDTLDEEIFEPLLGKKDAKSRYGQTTTHMGKLLPLLQGGGGGGCPVIVFGISPALYDPKT